jgi:SAM-dependent MidA family methyltransferase
MSTTCRDLILQTIRKRGPLTFAQFMEIALYDPDVGYYARAARRSGRTGDFYTSVDVSALFGELLAEQIAEMARLVLGPELTLGACGPHDTHAGCEGRSAAPDAGPEFQFGARPAFDLVEAGAGNGRLSRDVLDALERLAPDVYEALRLHLVERSAAARDAQRDALGRHAKRLFTSGPDLPPHVSGVVFANELLDALPTHAVVAREDGLHEVVIDARGDDLVEGEAPPSTPALAEYLARLDVRLPPGFRTEVNLDGVEWVRRAARALERGFLLLVDYGHEAATLYSASHAAGTLATFTGHVVESREAGRPAPWLRDPGSSDITAHVDFTSIRRTAQSEGLECLCLVDQMHFLLGLGIERRLHATAGNEVDQIVQRLALKTLLVPGGLGTTHQVMIFSKKLGRPTLRGCALARSANSPGPTRPPDPANARR